MKVSSPAFAHGQPIPARFTCDGENVAPELRIEGVPADAKALALLLDDPDAPRGTWTHWTWWDMPASVTTIPEKADIARLGGVEGVTSNKAVGYHGPCPPNGKHRYIVKVYALDGRIGLPRGASIDGVRAAVSRHTVAMAELMGTFSR